ncbi:hypothetical protein LTR49_028011 [Elasticomyces elasticus]|nr:hypothetical protein LTR49_028011 [Elasticomyces elasticus]
MDDLIGSVLYEAIATFPDLTYTALDTNHAHEPFVDFIRLHFPHERTTIANQSVDLILTFARHFLYARHAYNANLPEALALTWTTSIFPFTRALVEGNNNTKLLYPCNATMHLSFTDAYSLSPGHALTAAALSAGLAHAVGNRRDIKLFRPDGISTFSTGDTSWPSILKSIHRTIERRSADTRLSVLPVWYYNRWILHVQEREGEESS